MSEEALSREQLLAYIKKQRQQIADGAARLKEAEARAGACLRRGPPKGAGAGVRRGPQFWPVYCTWFWHVAKMITKIIQSSTMPNLEKRPPRGQEFHSLVHPRDT